MNATPQQQKIFDHVTNNERRGGKRTSLVVNAKAGTGKSTTCAEAMKRLPNASIAYVTFGKDVNEDFKRKLEGVTNVRVGTAHSFGNGAMLDNSKSKCKERFSPKVKGILKELYKSHPKAFQFTPVMAQLVNYAKDAGVGLLSDSEDPQIWSSLIERFGLEVNDSEGFVIAGARAALKASNEDMTSHDFADMIYLPLLRNYQFERFDYVFIDEAQDTNATRREMFKRMVKPHGCVVVVGDRNQAIYGFTGSDNDSMDRLKETFECVEMELTTCFRCDRSIIREAQKIVPGIMPTSDAGEGKVVSRTYASLLKPSGDIHDSTFQLRDSDAILCRYNAPNVRLAFALLRRGIPCRIEGRNIGIGLLQLIQKLGGATIDELSQNVDEYEIRELDKARGKPARMELVTDKCSTLRVLIERARDQRWGLKGLEESITSMFSDANDPKTPRNVLTLSSIHKSKGREWPRVFILGRSQFMPSKYAEQAWALEQEENLAYVAVTRAKHELVYITNVPEK